MGLWDILVPTEPGVLHNLIANPSFEYDNNEVNDISYTYNETTTLGFPELSGVELQSFRTLPSNTGVRYWHGDGNTAISRSSDWASRGGFSLKITQGATTNPFYYAPRLSAPSYFDTTISASWFNNTADNGNIPTSKDAYIAVVGLTDIGMALANGVVDSQVYATFSVGGGNGLIAYPTIDAMRGHMKPIFTTLAASGSNFYSIKVQISNFNEEVANNIRGWAVFVSQDATATKVYHLSGIIPATRKNWALVSGAYVAPNEYQLIIGNIPSAGTGATPLPFTPTLGTGTLYMFPLGTNGNRIVRGKGTSFLTQFQHDATSGITSGIDVYVVITNEPTNKKQFLGKTLSRGVFSSSGTLSCTSGSTSVTLTGEPSGFDLVGRALYVGSTVVGIVASAASSSSITLESNAPSTITNSLYSYSVDSQTEFQLEANATQIVVNTAFYYANETNPQAFPDNNFGAISSFSTNGTTYLPASMGKDCSVPYFGITNSSFPADAYKHHLYLDWYIKSSSSNPNAIYTGTGKDWSIYLVNTKLDSAVTSETVTITVGATTGTTSAIPSFAVGALLFTSTYDFVGVVSYADTSSGYFELYNPARMSLSGVTVRFVSSTVGTFVGTLDDSTATDSAAYRMRFRRKFLIDRPAGDTSDMMLRFVCTSPSNTADLYIDGVQFVDAGMIWRSYDFYSTNPLNYNNPPHFSDWDWDDVEFSYIDGDVPGAMWSDTMPTQSGTTAVGWPYFSDNGIWMREVWNESTSQIQQGGYSSPAMREQRQWRNEGKPVYGVSVPGLSQSSLQTQTFETGFWAPLDTDNINVVVEPTISGTGLPEIATTALEYGIVDGGFVQRQVARMRNMQFTVTISAQSWTGLHANRRSIINLLKFDQLAQQGERMLRYRGATTPVTTKITYVGGLEFGGVQTQSFTETLGLRFLSADPYFYTEVPLSQDISPTELDASNLNTVYYRLGNNSEWRPISAYTSQIDIQDSVYTVKPSANSLFLSIVGGATTSVIPKAIGWLQSPSGNVSTLVVGGNFQYPFPSLAFFYVSGFRPDTTMAADSVEFISSGTVTFSSALNSTNATYSATFDSMAQSQTGLDVFLYTAQGVYVGKIVSVNTILQTFVIDNNVHPAYTNTLFYVVYVRDISVASPPLMVYGRQLFQLDGGTSAITTSVNDIYQESPTSLLVVGDFYRVSEIGMQQPNTNFNTTSTFKNEGKVSSRVVSNDIPYSVYFRVARFVMNDNGKIVVYPADAQFDSVYSVVYNLIEDRPINKVTKAQSGYVFLGTDTANSVDGYDSINGQEYEEYPVMRSPSAYAVARYQSSVVAMSPQINFNISTTDTEVYAGFVGFRLGRQAQGTITTYPSSFTSQFLAIGNNVSFTASDIGKTIITSDGLYVGQIFGFLEQTNTTTYSIAVLTEPAKSQVTNSPFILLSAIQSITVDKRTTNATVIAALTSNDDSNYRTSVWGYVPNPTVQGRLSVVADSTSFGYVGSIQNDLGLTNAGLINANTGSAIIKGQKTAFTTNMIGNYLETSNGLFLGQVKSVESTTSLTLTQNAFANAGGVVPTNFALTKGLLSASSTSLTIVTATTSSFIAGDVGKYLYLYDTNSKRLTYVGVISAYTSATQIAVATNEINQAFNNIKGVISTVAFYVSYNVRTQKLFTKADGYIARAGYIQTANSITNTGTLFNVATTTSSTTQTQGFSKNAPTMFTETTSSYAIVNAQSLPDNTLTSYILRRNFSADSTISDVIYDPSNANNERVAYASYTFGSVRPYIQGSVTAGTLTFFGRYIQTSSTLITGRPLFLNYNNESIVFVGVVSGTTTVQGATYYLLAWAGTGSISKPVLEYSFTHTAGWWQPAITDAVSAPWINWDSMRTEPVKAANFDPSGVEQPWTFSSDITIYGEASTNMDSPTNIGRSVYRMISPSSYTYLGIIKSITTVLVPIPRITLNITPSATPAPLYSTDNIYLSGGTRTGSTNGVTWYPYQFGVRNTLPSASSAYAIYDTGMESSIAYTGSGATPAPTCTSGGIITLNLQLTSDYQCPPPTGITANTYDLYAYLSGYPGADVYIPSQVGQWDYIGEITATTSSSISYRANSSGAGNTIVASTTSAFATITGTPNAQQLVGSNIYRSDTGAFLGRVIDVNANNTAQVRFSGNAAATFTGTYYHSPSFPINTALVRGTPLSIVNRLTIYTDSPASYAVGDELLAYAFDNNDKPRYIGTVQKIVSTTSGTTVSSVTVSYYPVFYDEAGLSAPYIDVDVSSLSVGIYSGYTTILRASKTVRGSATSNYFANAIGIVNTTTANNYNIDQTASITLPSSPSFVSPNQYQIIDIPTTTFTANTELNNISFSLTSVLQSNSLSVIGNNTTITSTGVALQLRKAFFRADGKIIGYNNAAANTLVTSPLYSTGGLQMPYTYCSLAYGGTTPAYATITCTSGSATVTFTASTSLIVAEDLVGRALFELSLSSQNPFVGVVKTATSATSLTLYAPSPVSLTAVRFAYSLVHTDSGTIGTITNTRLAPITTPATITASTSSATATRSGVITNFGWAITSGGGSLTLTKSFANSGLFRLNGQYIGYATTATASTNTISLNGGTINAYASTSGEEHFIFMNGTVGANATLQTTASPTVTQIASGGVGQTVPTNSVGCAIYRISIGATAGTYTTATWLGIVATVSGATFTTLSGFTVWTGRSFFISPIGDKPTACAPSGLAGRVGSITTTLGSKQFTLSFPNGVVNGCAANDMPGCAVFDGSGNVLGIVEYADTAYVGYFRDNATASVSNSTFFWAPTSLPMTIANENQVRSLTPSRRGFVTSVAGSPLVTVSGQPDAYSLVNRTLRDGSGNVIGVGASASNHNTLTLTANALVSTTNDYQYTYSASTTDGSNIPISTVAFSKYAPTSAFASVYRPSTNAIFRQNGEFMGFPSNLVSTNSYRWQFLHMPYSVTMGNDEWVIYMTNPNYGGYSNPPSAHYPTRHDFYGTISTIGQTTFTTSFANPSWLVGAALYIYNTFTGRVASVSGTTVTLIDGALAIGNIDFASFTPYILVIENRDAIGCAIYPYSATTPSDYMGIVEDIAYANMGALTAPARTIENMFSRSYLPGLFDTTGPTVSASYNIVSAALKYTLQVGDVLRNSSNAIVGQVWKYDWQNRQLFLANTARVNVASATLKVHHKSSNSRFIGEIVGAIRSMQYQDNTYTSAIIKGFGTRFSTIPYDVVHRSLVQEYDALYSGSVSSTQIDNPWEVGTEFYILSNETYIRLGVIYDILDDTTMVLTLSVEGQSFGSFTGQSYNGGYSMLSVPGLGGAIVSNTGYVTSALNMSYTPEFPSTLIPNLPTKFAEQAVNGAYIWFLDTSPTGLSVDGYVHTVFTNNLMGITAWDGSPRNLRSNNGAYIYSIAYRYDESILWDYGEQVYVNSDWQPFGAHNGQVLDVTTTQNGTIIASGKFTKWSDATDTTNASSRNVGRVARLVPLIANGVIFDAYASPIIGSSYVNNGMNGTAYVTRDITDINPVTGYVGSSDRLLIGGSFTETLDGEKVSPGIVSVEGTTLSGNLQSIVSSDIQFVKIPYTIGATSVFTEVKNIASSTRLRQYYSNPNTNNLDGINGANIAVITNDTKIERTTQFYSLRVRGNASTYPVMVIRNVVGRTVKVYELLQSETGARIRFSNNGLQVLEYETITINCIPGQRSITSNIRGNMLSFLHPSSNLVDWVLLGSNNSAGKAVQSFDDYRLNVIGVHSETGVIISISYTPRFWSFDANNLFFGTTKAGV